MYFSIKILGIDWLSLFFTRTVHLVIVGSLGFVLLVYRFSSPMAQYERVRVVSRVRPFTDVDPEDADLSVIVVDKKHVSLDGTLVYEVDDVFSMESETKDLFDRTVRPLINDFLGGYNITLMAYGQTGTGKTYTMGGLTPMVIEEIVTVGFRGNIEELSFQFIEVYGEKIRDLLSEDPVESSEHLQLYDDASEGGGTLLTGAVRVRARSLRQVMEVVEHGTKKRATGGTNMNEYSSRSHSIFTIFNHRDKSKLHLVDLAGSERADKTQNVGQRFQESIGINSGLLALGNVIRALRKNHSAHGSRQHVPYRSSKLTRILQDSLGGNSRTVFIACIAPDSYNKRETKRTLEYCTLALQVYNSPMPNYAMLYEEQAGAKSSPEDYLLHQNVPTTNTRVPQEMFNELLEEKRQRDDEVKLLREELHRMSTRVTSLEAELLKDETIFKRQIAEIQRLSKENEKCRRRIDYLEGHPHLVSLETSRSRHNSEAAVLVERVMRMHGFNPTPESSARNITAATRPSQSSLLRSEGKERKMYVAADEEVAACDDVAEEFAVMNREKQQSEMTADLVKKALMYQTTNSDLKGRMSTLEALLDRQQRESAMLRLEVQQLKGRGSPRAVDPLSTRRY